MFGFVLMILVNALGLQKHRVQQAGTVAMHYRPRACQSENALLPRRDFRFDSLPRHLCRPHGAASLAGSSVLKVRRISTSEGDKRKQTNRSIGCLQICFASTQSPKQPEAAATEKSFWPSLLPRSPIYSSNLSDVDPVQADLRNIDSWQWQLSELWLQTLRVKRDPQKIVKALRHSFTFVVVLVEDGSAPSTTGSRLKTVGVGRAVSDGSFIATICDVAVDPAYRNRGIGRRIVKRLVENIKKIGGPSGFAVFPPPLARRFFWMVGFRSDRKYRIMAYRGNPNDGPTDADDNNSSQTGNGVTEME